VYEEHNPYHHEVVLDKPIEKFIENMSSIWNESWTVFLKTELKYLLWKKTFVSYAENTGGDKPMMVMLIGITPDML
jgi:hypothetical protein